MFLFRWSAVGLLALASGRAAALEPGAVDHRVLEGEVMALTPPMVALQAAGASRDSYVIVPNGAGVGGVASRTLHIPAAGRYYLHGRTLAPNGGDNSFWVEIAGQRYEWHVTTGPAWRWGRVTHQTSPGVHEPVIVTIAAPGDYELRLLQREDGTALDQLVFTNDANFAPSGIENESIHWEAEDAAAIVAPFVARASPLASRETFVTAPNGSAGGGRADYVLDVSQGGEYTLHGRVLAPGVDDDAFLVQLDGDSPQAWDLPEHAGWRWVSGPRFTLAPGSHSLRLLESDDGAAIDELILTADAACDPDRLAYARRLRPLARQHVDTPFPDPDALPIGKLHYAIPALWLNEEVSTANAYLEQFQQDGSSLLMVTAVLGYLSFADGAAPYPARISQAAADNLAAELWEYTEATSTLHNASRPPSEVLGSENLHVTQLVVNYLTAQTLRGHPLYAGRTLRDGGTLAQHHEAWRAYLPGYLDWRAKKGLFVEIASPIYAKYTTMALLLLQAFADDPAVAGKARAIVDLMLADWAQDQVARVRGGGKSRSYLGVLSWHANRDAYNALGNWLFAGEASPRNHISPYLLTTGYLPPKLVTGLANRVASEPFVAESRRPGVGTRTVWTDPWTGIQYLVYDVDDQRSVLRNVYVAPELVVGSVTIDGRIAHTAISGQNRWHGVVFSANEDARVFVEVEPVAGEENVYDAHVVAQAGRVLVAQKKRNGDSNNGRSRVYFASSLDHLEETGGWIFAEAGDGFVAVRVVDGSYAWTSPATRNGNTDPALNYVNLEREYSPVILEAGRRADHATLAAFEAYVLSNPLSWDGTVLRYGSVDGEVEYPTANHTTLPRIDGEEPAFAMASTFRGGPLSSTFDSGVHVARYAGNALTLDTAASTCAAAPPETAGLHLSGGAATVLSWDAAAGAVSYDVERGLVSRLRAEDLGVCRSAFDPDPTDLAFADGETPAPGEAFFYVVRARNDGCEAIGTRGTSSSGTERVNRNPDGCY